MAGIWRSRLYISSVMEVMPETGGHGGRCRAAVGVLSVFFLISLIFFLILLLYPIFYGRACDGCVFSTGRYLDINHKMLKIRQIVPRYACGFMNMRIDELSTTEVQEKTGHLQHLGGHNIFF